MSEQEFLETYDKTQFDLPLLTVDAVIFTFHEAELKVLLVQRNSHPERGKWSLPGGFVDTSKDDTLESTARRKVIDKTGVTPQYLEQVSTVGSNRRDKRGWSASVCYTALVAFENCKSDNPDIAKIAWVGFDRIPSDLAFDHAQLIYIARERLKQKALYSIVPAFVLPEKFTLPELQHIHEALIGKTIQTKSFRRRIEQAGLLIDTGDTRSEGARPAVLYRLTKAASQFKFIRNLEA